MLLLLGMPETLYYERSFRGSGNATFRCATGKVASLALTYRSANNGGMERTTIISEGRAHIVVDNNIRVSYDRNPPVPEGQGYGRQPDYYTGAPDQATAVWEPEFSLGQLYNKGLFLLGYYDEVNAFARGILEGRPPELGTLEHAWQATRIFEAFFEGPGRAIRLDRLG